MRLGLGFLDVCPGEEVWLGLLDLCPFEVWLGFLMGEPFRTWLRLVGGRLVGDLLLEGFGGGAKVEADERVMRFREEALGSKA